MAPSQKDPALYAHHADLRSAVTGGPVIPGTELTPLHLFKGSNSDNELLKDTNHIARPAVPCQLEDADGMMYPPNSMASEHGYKLYVTYNRLMVAPCIRLECRFYGRGLSESGAYHLIALEFHFRPCSGKELRFYNAVGNVITFKTNGATSAGMNKLKEFESRFQEPEKAVVALFQRLCPLQNPRKVKLHLDLSDLDLAESQRLAKIQARLPGGTGMQLESLSHPEFSMFLNDRGNYVLGPNKMSTPNGLITSDVPHALVPQECADTYTSITDAQIQLGESAHIADAECRVSLKFWASVQHRCRLFCVDGFPIIAVRFERTPQLGSAMQEARFRLPRELFAKMRLMGRSERSDFEGYLAPETLDLPHHQAFFVVTSHPVEWFVETFNWSSADETYRRVKFEPHINSFTFQSQLQTINIIPAAQRWHRLILNQSSSTLPVVDLTANLDIDPERIAEADRWLRNFRQWNPEQLEVIDSIHKAKGGVIIVMGIAGTGKTLLQSALSIYFAMLNIKAGVFPPANSNADHSTKASVALAAEVAAQDSTAADEPGSVLNESIQGDPNAPDHDSDNLGAAVAQVELSSTVESKQIRAHRLYPSSRNYGFENLSHAQAKHHKVGHINCAVSSIDGFEFKNKSFKDRKTGARDLAIEAGVRDEALKGQLSYKDQLFEGGPKVDVWEVLRLNMKASDEGKFNWNNVHDKEVYSRSYEACKGHLVALTDIIVTTTGNARCSELLEHWVRCTNKYEIPCNGFVALLDESAKDQEINTLMALLAGGKKVVGAIMFGDDKQLAPTNTSLAGKVRFNMYGDRLNIALPLRLVREGFPYISLKEQQRMHPCLSEFPNEEFYGGELRDGPRVKQNLEDVKPGFAHVLHTILSKGCATPTLAESYMRHAVDEQARHAYIEVEGSPEFNEDTKSVVVHKHLDVFFKHIFPGLQKYFKEKTRENLMIICGYTWALVHYEKRFIELRKQQKLPDSHYPVVTLQSPWGPPTTNDQHSSSNAQRSLHASQHATTSGEEDIRHVTSDFYPRLLTIDSAQGQESPMVIMDGSFQKPELMGFMTDRGRCNVAMTRAIDVFWILGGPLRYRGSPQPEETELTPFVKLKRKMERLKRVHRFSAPGAKGG